MNSRISLRAIYVTVTMALVMVVSSVCFAFAANTVYTEGYLKYTIKEDSITIIEYFGDDKTVTVPNQIAGTPVNTIAKGTFVNTPATKINLPDTITSIEDGAIGSGITIVYNSNTKSPETIKPGSGDKKDEDKKPSKKDKDKTVVINKGQTIDINKKTYTVTKGVQGSSLKGTVLEDKKGNEYTVNEKGEILDKDGNVVGTVPEGSYSSIETGDVSYDEADVSLDEEEAEGPAGLTMILCGICVVLAAALAIILKKKGVLKGKNEKKDA